MGKKRDYIRKAVGVFDGYARHHLAKVPADIEKADNNIAMAKEGAAILGDDYDRPVVNAAAAPIPPADLAFEDGRFSDWRADFRAKEAESEPRAPEGPFGSAKALLKAVYGTPMLGVHVPLDDQPIMQTCIELGMLLRDDVSDVLTITAKGREAVGIKPDGVPDLPVEVQEQIGDIEERELVARYVEGKIKGLDVAIKRNNEYKDAYDICASILTELAHEARIGLYLPTVHVEGRVIPYNETRDTGITHADELLVFFRDVHERNVKAGWWTNIETGEPLKRNVGEMFMLMVTELWEAYDAYAHGEPDDKLPEYPGIGVELGDLLIRIADFCGALMVGNVIDYDPDSSNPGENMFLEVGDIAKRYEAIRKTPQAKGDPETAAFLMPMDVAVMVDAKLAFNATREDHKIENRLKEDGKRT